jgi:hypothetical protein
VLVVSAVLAFARSARALVVYDLETYFSNGANPNGA